MNLRDYLYEGDLPDDVYDAFRESKILGIDTETTGLDPVRDRLCLVQMQNDRDQIALVKIKSHREGDRWAYSDCPNLRSLLWDASIIKIIQYAQFDLKFLRLLVNFIPHGVYCTRVASKIARTATDKHGLKDIVREICNVEINKSEQSSDWARPDLTDDQLQYAHNDVLYLIPVYEELERRLKREGRWSLAKAAMSMIPTLIEMDMAGFNDVFIR